MLQLPGMAAAALVECPPIAATPGSKVVVDEVRPSAGGGAALSAFEARRLQNAIHQQIAQLSAERPADVQAVICAQRWPEGPEAFSQALSRNLLDHNVLIELWGESDQGLALIQYAVLPVRIRADTHLPGIYASAYSFGAGGGIETLFRDARELRRSPRSPSAFAPSSRRARRAPSAMRTRSRAAPNSMTRAAISARRSGC
jgi:hypothetical protein